jgi:hypothetical protein
MMDDNEDQMEADQYHQQMDGMPEGMEDEMDYDQENDDEINFENLRDIIEKTEDAGNDQVVESREANYISKGTYIWTLLQ